MADRDTRRRALAVVGNDPDTTFYVGRALEASGGGDEGGSVLVLGSADGRVAVELAARGFQVVAVEPSGLMMQLAEERRSGQTPEVQSRLRLLTGDLRAIRLSEKFPVVLSPQNALGTFATLEDLESALATAAFHLAPEGLLAFDLTAGHHEGTHSVHVDGQGHPHGPGASGESARRIFLPHLRERRRSPDSNERASSLRRLRVRLFTPAEIDGALARAGLVAHERNGDFLGNAFGPEDALQVIVGGKL